MNRKRLNLRFIMVALAGCMIYAISAGIRSNYGTLISAISQHSGVPYASVSFVLAVAQLSFGIMQPVFGMLALKKSYAFVLEIGAALLAVGLLMIPVCRSFWMLLLFHHVGRFLSSWIGGILVSYIGSYSPVWIFSAVLAAGAALISLRIQEEPK